MASMTTIASGHNRAGEAADPVVHAAIRKMLTWPAATTTEVSRTTGNVNKTRFGMSPPP